jgi:hypothetical protein
MDKQKQKMNEKKYTKLKNGFEKEESITKPKKMQLENKKLLTGRAPYPSTVLTLRSNLSS